MVNKDHPIRARRLEEAYRSDHSSPIITRKDLNEKKAQQRKDRSKSREDEGEEDNAMYGDKLK